MNYTIGKGLEESELPVWLKQAAKKYGTFEDGRVNYTNAPIAPVVMCTLKFGDKILLAKRGHGLADAEGYWSTINGFIDENKSVSQIASQEFREELGLKLEPKSIKVAPSYKMKSQQEKREYIVFPCLAVIDYEPDIKLDYEHTEFKWIRREGLEKYHILDDLPLVIDSALKLL
ncbi:MAG TPA: NUDIX domain-containing protein [Candidatus Saccharimonadales bacterium]|nr:NUDIX domain-containing protein [Candidatus Saccharimonadales bacterium]